MPVLALTDIDLESILYLLSHEEGEQMKGTIRVKGLCPKCGGKFTSFGKSGFLCTSCKCRPERYYIDLPLKGQRHRIFSDDRGYPLDTFSRTKSLLDDINYDIRNESFDPKKYRQEEREKFYLDVRWDVFKKRQTNPGYLHGAETAEAHFFEHFRKSQDVRSIKQTDLNLLAEKLMQSGLTVGTIKAYFKPILSMLHHDKSQGIAIQDLGMPPFPKKLEKQQATNSYIPEISETLEILSRIPEILRDLYLFILTHGCRPSEARAMKAKDFNFTNNTVRFVRGFSVGKLVEETKTHDNEGNAEALPIHKDMLERLRELCLTKNPDDFLFTHGTSRHKGKPFSDSLFRKTFAKAAKAAGLSKVAPYKALKHASLSSMAAQSGDIYNTSKMARHSSTTITEKNYTKKYDLDAIGKVQMTLRIPNALIPKS